MKNAASVTAGVILNCTRFPPSVQNAMELEQQKSGGASLSGLGLSGDNMRQEPFLTINEDGSYEPSTGVDNRTQWIKVSGDTSLLMVGDRLRINQINSVIRECIIVNDELFPVRDRESGKKILTVIKVEQEEIMVTPSVIAWGPYKNSSSEYRKGMALELITP